jgi:hypothetical protein
MSCQFHRICLPAQVDEEQWFCDNDCCTNVGLRSERHYIFYHVLFVLWVLNLAISTEFPYLGGVVGGQFL